MDMNEWMSGLRSFSSKIGKPIPSGQKTIFETYISDSLFDYIDEPRIQEACLKGHTSVFDNIPNSEEWDQLSFLILQYLGDVFEMGSTFGDAYRVKEVHGFTVSEKYGVSSGLFFNFATAYWTFNVEVMDLFNKYGENRLTLSHLLVKADMFVYTSCFPPLSGQDDIQPWQRRDYQSSFLNTFCPNTNIEAFMQNNPTV